MYIRFAGCLALRIRNGRLKNSFNPGGTLPTHPVDPKKWTYACINMKGLLKWPSTSLVTYCTLYFGLPYSYIWETQHRSYLTLGRQKTIFQLHAFAGQLH